MSVVAPLKIDVYDKTFEHRGRIGDPKFCTVIPRFNEAGTCTIGLRSNHRMVPVLFEEGSRIRIRDENGYFLMSGWCTKIRGTGPAKAGQLEFDFIDDFIILSEILGWVQPAQTIDNQGIAGDNWTMTGTAEAVLKAAVTANGVTRLGLPITVAASLGRGSSVTAKLRFHPLFERLFPVVDGAGIAASGIGVTMRQQASSIVLDAYVPQVHPRDLTESSGVIEGWSYTAAAPTATRVVVGGQGEAQLRVFRRLEDLPREALWGRKIERFRDARDTNDNLLLYARGQETLDEGAAKYGLSVQLSQTANFRYGDKVKVGDTVTMKVGPGTSVTDVLTEATLSWTQDDGWKATPRVGERSDDPDWRLARTIKNLARTLSNLNRT